MEHHSVPRPPGQPDSEFSDLFSKTLGKCITHFDFYSTIGDLNYDLLTQSKCRTLTYIMELLDLTNIVKNATCFMKNCQPSLLDVILPNSKKKKICMKTFNFGTGVSDCHNIIGTVINSNTTKDEKKKIQYKSFRNFNSDVFNEKISNIKLQIQENPDSINPENINMLYDGFESNIKQIIDDEIPTKQKYLKKTQVPYMNRDLLKAIYKKKMNYTKYLKNKNSKSRKRYRKSRNYVNKLKKVSINKYFQERCIGECKNTDFWKTIKAYLSKKSSITNSKIILSYDQIISTDTEASEIFISFFVNVAKDIGKDAPFDKETHPSIQKISLQKFLHGAFNFKPISQGAVSKIIDKFNSKKATGVDKISAKILKLGKSSLVPFYTDLINLSIKSEIFPDRLKQAQVTPIFKKNDPLTKS
ncbi:uncharacterized protein LOC128559906 isoform X2 [Mercenaria mercenaria]|uniref:uncharacterized protein LOC128559906 isoform X2 n=1 Tax=Mercenaria mercenaria TaxID=6596 RepID=UPI00234F51BC|nr:uncharacterized protein LOC128559906 isoform X2 [Mercenaria mercenaria]XP_053408957.1 uncharacterized protein LOC128559906 isoform X2 [Mercenaria mercenaria]XP_053408958.1 uncharacterized protein LOC128559906 isoform X2 [Mercenaria mercenaria]